MSFESGHWYTRDGRPFYEVPRSDGSGMRPATLKDARLLGLYPGVTTILRCAAARIFPPMLRFSCFCVVTHRTIWILGKVCQVVLSS